MNEIIELIDDWARETRTSTIMNYNFQTSYYTFEFVRAIKLEDGYMHGYKVSRTLPSAYVRNFVGTEDIVIIAMLDDVDKSFKKVEVKDNGSE